MRLICFKLEPSYFGRLFTFTGYLCNVIIDESLVVGGIKMDESLDYYVYADDDYKFLTESIDAGIFRTSMASIAQETCTRYLKHIIITRFSLKANDVIMATHSLRKLVRFIQDCTNDFKIDEEKTYKY